jgi:hypothetical protein
MIRVTVSERGLRVLGSGLIVGFMGLLFKDLLLLALFTTLFVVFGYSYLRTHSQATIFNGAMISGQNKIVPLTAGRTYEESFVVSPAPVIAVKPKSTLEYMSYSTSASDGALNVGLRFEPKLSGTYMVHEIEFELSGPLGLVNGYSELPFGLEFKVYPRVYEAALEAVAVLSGGDALSMGESPTRLLGSGYEYADTRPYASGDAFRMIDWKASARWGRMMTRDYFIEGGAYRHVIYDAYSTDPVSSDVLASSYLRLVTSLARLGSRLGLSILKGAKVESYYLLSPNEAVALAIGFSLELSQGSLEDFYSILDVGNRLAVKNFLERVKGVKADENSGLREMLTDSVGLRISDALTEEGAGVEITDVSMLRRNIVSLLDLAVVCRGRGWLLNVIQPCSPWKTVEDLENSKRIYDSNQKTYSILSKSDMALFLSVEQMFSRSVPQGSQWI